MVEKITEISPEEKMNLTPFKQSKGYCGPAVLKIVLDYYGIKKSEKELARLTKTRKTTGCSEKEMIKLAKDLGFKSYIKQNSNINELKKLSKKGIPVIVDWFSPEECGHYSVLAGFNKDSIILADPHFGKIVQHKITLFNERWFDIINDKLILREIIVIYR
jgi:ABC-type bacteriocin/lantibiotic exporter with double-glycine peptidase domain